ncbi:hypothetical protein GQ600_22120 [Phytophthora cactorum]|nr:hypothetical protein GQ600_22120 [Phytophthora cactorum]
MQGDQAVGCRVQVYWEGEGEWFNGVVDVYSAERGYYVKYDDGEEQWEVSELKALQPQLDAGEYSIRFLTEPGSGRSDGVSAGIASSREEEERLDITGASPKDDSEAGSVEEYEDAYEDGEQEEPLEQDSDEEAAKPIAEKEDLASITATTKPQKAVKPARAFMRTSAAFFRDEDTLREMRQDLQWGERVLGQKLENQILAEELLALKTAVQDKQLSVQRKQKQRDEMSAKLSHVPRRHLCTLVDLQLEISRLLEEKRALETQPRPSSSRAKPEKMSSLNVSASTKAALQNELTSLEVTTERYKEELRQWHLKIDCEKARLAPLEARLTRYEDSQVLLRSVFLRLGPDKRDGCVPLEAALTAFQTLTPLDRDALAAEEMDAAQLDELLSSVHLLLEPIQLPDLSHTGVFDPATSLLRPVTPSTLTAKPEAESTTKLKLSKLDKSEEIKLFYPTGAKNANMRDYIKETIQKHFATEESPSLGASASAPILRSPGKILELAGQQHSGSPSKARSSSKPKKKNRFKDIKSPLKASLATGVLLNPHLTKQAKDVIAAVRANSSKINELIAK